MRLLALDFETYPDHLAGRRAWGLTGTEPEVVAQMLAKRREETEGKSDFLPLPFHQIIAYGAVGLNLESGKTAWEAKCTDDETAMVRLLHDGWFGGRPILLTWNGRQFDLPLLVLRAMMYYIQIPQIRQPHDAKKWSLYENRYGDAHIDLQDTLSNGGKNFKLAEACATLGIRVKDEGSSEEVAVWWEAGERPKIASHVLQDAKATAHIGIMYAHTSGWIDRKKMDLLLDNLYPASTAEPSLFPTTVGA